MNNRKKEVSIIYKRPVFDELSLEFYINNDVFTISGPVSPEKLKKLKPADGLNALRPAEKQHEALMELALSDDGMVFVCVDITASAGIKENDRCIGTIVSYVAFQKSDFPWWQNNSFPELIELGAMETDPRWRRIGLTSALLGALFNNPDFSFFEKMVVFTLQTSFNWDIRGTGLSPWEYRRMMIRYFRKFGFLLYNSNDPEVNEDPCGFILARIGKEAPEGASEKFTCCCLGEV